MGMRNGMYENLKQAFPEHDKASWRKEKRCCINVKMQKQGIKYKYYGILLDACSYKYDRKRAQDSGIMLSRFLFREKIM